MTGRPDPRRPRPTLRCLRDDLELPVPSLRVSLEEVDHPLIAKAAEQFADPETPHERIRSIDDAVLFKLKVARWRGAVLVDDDDPDVRDWLVASGQRELMATAVLASIPTALLLLLAQRYVAAGLTSGAVKD